MVCAGPQADAGSRLSQLLLAGGAAAHAPRLEWDMERHSIIPQVAGGSLWFVCRRAALDLSHVYYPSIECVCVCVCVISRIISIKCNLL